MEGIRNAETAASSVARRRSSLATMLLLACGACSRSHAVQPSSSSTSAFLIARPIESKTASTHHQLIPPRSENVDRRRIGLCASYGGMSGAGEDHQDEEENAAAAAANSKDKKLAAPLSRQKGVSRDGFIGRGLLAIGLGTSSAAAAGFSSSSLVHAASISDSDLPPVAFKTKSGLRYYDVREGKGPSPNWGQVCILQYEGYVRPTPFSKLVLFDDTYARKTPFIIKHGNGRVIRGLDEGLHTMKLGGLRRIVVPLQLGYTKTGLGPIPPNALRRKILVRELSKAEASEPTGEIVYDVELVSVYDDEADLGYYSDLTFDGQFLQDGLAKALNELRDKGIKVPSTKTFMTKPTILGGQRGDVVGLPDNLL